jgi:hypothetical protein
MAGSLHGLATSTEDIGVYLKNCLLRLSSERLIFFKWPHLYLFVLYLPNSRGRRLCGSDVEETVTDVTYHVMWRFANEPYLITLDSPSLV